MTELERSLIDDIPKLNADSQMFMRWIMDRVIGIGLKSYGPWSAENESRDMDREIADELADAVVYSGMRAVMKAQRRYRDSAPSCSEPLSSSRGIPQSEQDGAPITHGPHALADFDVSDVEER